VGTSTEACIEAPQKKEESFGTGSDTCPTTNCQKGRPTSKKKKGVGKVEGGGGLDTNSLQPLALKCTNMKKSGKGRRLKKDPGAILKGGRIRVELHGDSSETGEVRSGDRNSEGLRKKGILLLTSPPGGELKKRGRVGCGMVRKKGASQKPGRTGGPFQIHDA